MPRRTPEPSGSAEAVSRVAQARRPNKYGAVRTVIDGRRFASGKEARRYAELTMAERAGDIMALECQPRFRLEVNGMHVCDYVADFAYVPSADWCERHGLDENRAVVEDVKSSATRRLPVYRLKRKLMRACLGIEVLET